MASKSFSSEGGPPWVAPEMAAPEMAAPELAVPGWAEHGDSNGEVQGEEVGREHAAATAREVGCAEETRCTDPCGWAPPLIF